MGTGLVGPQSRPEPRSLCRRARSQSLTRPCPLQPCMATAGVCGASFQTQWPLRTRIGPRLGLTARRTDWRLQHSLRADGTPCHHVPANTRSDTAQLRLKSSDVSEELVATIYSSRNVPMKAAAVRLLPVLLFHPEDCGEVFFRNVQFSKKFMTLILQRTELLVTASVKVNPYNSDALCLSFPCYRPWRPVG